MFGRRWAEEFERGEGRGHEGRRHGHGGHGRGHFGWHMRRHFFGPRGPFGRGGPFGGGGPFGPGGPFDEEGEPGGPGRGKRFFGRGDLKFVLLSLLQERPMHGYEMMKQLQERTGGFYTPSAGSVYPTLQMLEDRGFVTASEAEGKKVYAITDAGRAFLAEGLPEAGAESGWRGFRRGFSDEERHDAVELMNEFRQIAPLFASVWHGARQDPKKLKRLQRLLQRLRSDLAKLAEGTDEEVL